MQFESYTVDSRGLMPVVRQLMDRICGREDDLRNVLPLALKIVNLHRRLFWRTGALAELSAEQIWDAIWDENKYLELEISSIGLPAWKNKALVCLVVVGELLGCEFGCEEDGYIYRLRTEVEDHKQLIHTAEQLLSALQYVDGDEAFMSSIFPSISWVLSEWLKNVSLVKLLWDLDMPHWNSREYEFKIRTFLRHVCQAREKIPLHAMVKVCREAAFGSAYKTKMNLKKDYEISAIVTCCVKLLLENPSDYKVVEYGANPKRVSAFFELMLRVEEVGDPSGGNLRMTDVEKWKHLWDLGVMPETFWEVLSMVRDGSSNIDIAKYFIEAIGANYTYSLGSMQSIVSAAMRFLEYLIIHTYKGMGSMDGLLKRALKYEPEKVLGAVCHNMLNGEG